MTKSQIIGIFSNLPMKRKLSVINDNNFHSVMDRIFLQYNIKLLYSHISGFYVEIWVKPNGDIFNIFPFIDTGYLKPYLNKIDITDITNVLG